MSAPKSKASKAKAPPKTEAEKAFISECAFFDDLIAAMHKVKASASKGDARKFRLAMDINGPLLSQLAEQYNTLVGVKFPPPAEPEPEPEAVSEAISELKLNPPSAVKK